MNIRKASFLFTLCTILLVAAGFTIADQPLRIGSAPSRPGETATTEAILSGEVTWSLAPVGITDGQLLRVNYLNTGSSPLEIIPCIFDGDGAHLKTGELLFLRPGQTISFDINRAEAGPRAEPRILVRGAAHVRNTDDKNLFITGEVIETTTGRSSLLVPGTRVGFDPQPDPPKTN